MAHENPSVDGCTPFIDLNAWDDLHPWIDYRRGDIVVTDELALPVATSVRRFIPSLHLAALNRNESG